MRLLRLLSILGLLLIAAPAFSVVVVNMTALEHKLATDIETQYRENHFIETDDRIHIVFNFPTQDKVLKFKGSQFTYSSKLSNDRFFAFNNVALITLKTEQEQKIMAMPLTISLQKWVWRTTQYVPAGSVLTPRLLEKAFSTVDSISPYPLNSGQFPSGQIARVNLVPGAILTQGAGANTKPVYLVHQNDTIRLQLKTAAGVRITTQATALQNGAEGERIKVTRRNNDGEKIIYAATVLSKNIATVDL